MAVILPFDQQRSSRHFSCREGGESILSTNLDALFGDATFRGQTSSSGGETLDLRHRLPRETLYAPLPMGCLRIVSRAKHHAPEIQASWMPGLTVPTVRQRQGDGIVSQAFQRNGVGMALQLDDDAAAYIFFCGNLTEDQFRASSSSLVVSVNIPKTTYLKAPKSYTLFLQ